MARKKATTEETTGNQKKSRNGCMGCLVAFLLLFLVIALFSCVSQNRSVADRAKTSRDSELSALETRYDEVLDDFSNIKITEPKDFVAEMDDQSEFARYEVGQLNDDYGSSDPVINKIKKGWEDLSLMTSDAGEAIRTGNDQLLANVEKYKNDLESQIHSIKSSGDVEIVNYSEIDRDQQTQWLNELEQQKSIVEQVNQSDLSPQDKAEQSRNLMSQLEAQTSAIEDATGLNQISYPLIRAYVDVREMAVAVKHMAENDEYDQFAQEYNECNNESATIINEIKQYLSEQE